jgi:N-acetylglucosaminyl-diphospho-decaprenol L-rhamnosyltransferase
MRLNIVIVNYRTPQLVIDCLRSLEGEISPSQDVAVVVDNASGDESADRIRDAIAAHNWRGWVQLLQAPQNGGFSAGNNLGISAVPADAYLLLNSDTIVRPGAISAMLAALSDHPRAGVVSPRLEWPDGEPQVSCFRFLSPFSELINAAATAPVTRLLQRFNVPIQVTDVPIQPDWTSFACVLIRNAVMKQVGLLDEGYFMYFDDVDYCRRVRSAGWTVLHWPTSRVVHLRGGSGPVKSAIAARKRPRRYLYESRARYFRKFYGRGGCVWANLAWLAGRSVSLFRELAGNKQPHTCESAATDIWTNWTNPLKPPTLPE